MKEQDHPDSTGHSEDIPSPDIPPPEIISAQSRSASRSSSEQEKTAPALSQRLATAFREGIASAKPDYDKRPEITIPPPVQSTVKKDRQQSGNARTLDRVIKEGSTAASVLYDKAAGALDSAARLAKTAPAVSTRWTEAFREGFASVRTREVKAKKDRIPHSVDRQPSDHRGIMARVLHVGSSAAEVVRDAVVSIQPGEARGAEKKIRMAEKKIKDLYVEIGHDAAGSWSRGGPLGTQKLNEFLDELRRNEEEIQNLREQIATSVAVKKADTVRSRRAAQEAGSSPARDKEDRSLDVGVSGAKLDEQVYSPGDWQQSASPEGGDFAVAETSVPAAPEAEAESPASLPEPKHTVGAEAVPQEEEGVVAEASEPPIDEPPRETSAAEAPRASDVSTEAAQQEEVSNEADQALPEEPEATQKKKVRRVKKR